MTGSNGHWRRGELRNRTDRETEPTDDTDAYADDRWIRRWPNQRKSIAGNHPGDEDGPEDGGAARGHHERADFVSSWSFGRLKQYKQCSFLDGHNEAKSFYLAYVL